MKKKERMRIIILAGGKGERMKSDLPKVLVKVAGKMMIKHLLESVKKSGIDENPVIVVGYKKEMVIRELGKENKKYDYAIQKKQLGTGHAVMSAEKILKNKTDHILVLYGDHPFVNRHTIKKLVKKHLESGGIMTMTTIKLTDFKGWRNFFYNSFSRIVRNKKGRIIKDVQFRDASSQEKKITEINPCFFCFNAKWLWQKLKILKKDNSQKQYYLTDLVRLAMQEKIKINSITINPREAMGANSKEELEILEKFAV